MDLVHLPVMPPLQPMLAKAASAVPSQPEGEPAWSYEPKWDGFRTIVFRDGDEVVLGSRGLGPFRSALASLVGQGSVSAYCLHRLSCAVAIVRGDPTALEANPVEPAIMVAVDGSPESQVALDWVGATPFPVDATFHLVTARPGDGDLVRWREGISCVLLYIIFLGLDRREQGTKTVRDHAQCL